MNEEKLKIIILTHGGAERFLELVSELDNVDVAGIFVETVTEKHRSLTEKLKRSIRYDGYLATFKKLVNRAGASNGNDVGLIDTLTASASKLGIPINRVENYHSEEAMKLIRRINADLGILYGTNIVKESVFSIPRLGSINLHQGLAPYYRGGPTVFWELFNGEKEVGITIHFVAERVDTGDIILQTTVPLSYDFSRYGLDYEAFLQYFRASLKEPSAKLLTEAVRQIAEGRHQRKRQDTSVGKRYRLPVKSEKNTLLRILRERHTA